VGEILIVDDPEQEDNLNKNLASVEAVMRTHGQTSNVEDSGPLSLPKLNG